MEEWFYNYKKNIQQQAKCFSGKPGNVFNYKLFAVIVSIIVIVV